MNDLISIIIPIYNVEFNLRKCIDSVVNQTYCNLEIILVDDGSPDNCGIICDEYAMTDNRIHVIHKKNGGLSDARNAGLDIIHGDYVAFVDSDDWIEPTMYEDLLKNLLKYDADISVGGVADELDDGSSIVVTKISDYGDDVVFTENKTEAMRRYFHGSWSAWDKLYKSFLYENIRFPVGEINEDEAIALDILDACNKICYSNKIYYHYIKRVNSTSITAVSFSKKKLAWKEHCRKNLNYIQRMHPELVKDAAFRYRNSLLWSLTEIAILKDDSEYQVEISKIMEELKSNKKIFDTVIFQSLKEKIRYRIVMIFGYTIYRKLLGFKRGVN